METNSTYHAFSDLLAQMERIISSDLISQVKLGTLKKRCASMIFQKYTPQKIQEFSEMVYRKLMSAEEVPDKETLAEHFARNNEHKNELFQALKVHICIQIVMMQSDLKSAEEEMRRSFGENFPSNAAFAIFFDILIKIRKVPFENGASDPDEKEESLQHAKVEMLKKVLDRFDFFEKKLQALWEKVQEKEDKKATDEDGKAIEKEDEKRLERFRCNIKRWLHKVLGNIAIDRIRKNQAQLRAPKLPHSSLETIQENGDALMLSPNANNDRIEMATQLATLKESETLAQSKQFLRFLVDCLHEAQKSYTKVANDRRKTDTRKCIRSKTLTIAYRSRELVAHWPQEINFLDNPEEFRIFVRPFLSMLTENMEIMGELIGTSDFEEHLECVAYRLTHQILQMQEPRTMRNTSPQN